jgi:hypothetical protein
MYEKGGDREWMISTERGRKGEGGGNVRKKERQGMDDIDKKREKRGGRRKYYERGRDREWMI